MKKQVRLSRFLSVMIITSLFIHACSTSSPENSMSVGTTPTPTASSGSSENNIASTPAAELVPSAPPPAQKIDVCSFFTSADAESIVGTALINITPGSDFDEITGGTLDYCTYKGDDVALVVSIVKSSAPKDSQEWQDQLLEMTKATDPDAAVTPASDIGERSYWVITEDSVGISVARFPYIFILAVGGNIGYSEDYKEDLNTLAQMIVNSLP
jgi:ABC-type Fe3+-hydroxamate transport system substrate-binding protein